MRLPSFESYPDDGGGTGEEARRIYGIGVYEEGEGIPVGTHGYVIDTENPTRFRGPFYIRTGEESGMWDGYRRMVDDELTQPSAPHSKEDLVRLADPAIEDQKLQEERQRILGSEISWVGDDWGEQGTIADFRVETEEGVEVLVFELTEESGFDRNGTYPRNNPTSWRFPVDEIEDCHLDGSLPDRLKFDHRTTQHGLRQYVVERKNIDPKVLEAQRVAMENKEQLDGWPQFEAARRAGDFDPRLVGHLFRDFSTSDLEHIQPEAADDNGSLSLHGGKEELGFVAKRLFSILSPNYTGFYPSNETRRLLWGEEREARADIKFAFSEVLADGEEPQCRLDLLTRKQRSQDWRDRIEEAVATALNPDEVEVDTLPRLTVG